jgi:hypothetical protein
MDTSRLGFKAIRRLVIAVLASSLLAGTAISFADEGKNFRYGLEGNNLVFTTPEEAIQGGSFRLAVKDGQRATISLELVDMVSNASGAKQPIPLNSSPFTPNGLVEFTTSNPVYEPSSEFRYFNISMKFKDDVSLDRPVLGGIQISLVPETPTQEESGVVSSIVATFAYLPATGLDLEQYSPALTLTGPTIDRRTPDFFPLNLLPNLPFVLNHGDLTLSHQLENTGKIFLETTTEHIVEQIGLFGQQDSEVFSESIEAFLVPEQFTEETTEVTLTGSNDQFLGIGVYRFSVTAAGTIGDQVETGASSQQTLIIFPWKQSFLFLILLVLFRRRIAKAFQWLIDLGKSFVEFRNSRKSSSNLAPGFVQEPRLGVAPATVHERSLSLELATITAPRTSVMLTPRTDSKLDLESKTALEPKPSLISKLTAIATRALNKIRAIKLKPKKASTSRLFRKASKAKPAKPSSTPTAPATSARPYSSTPTPAGFEVRPLYPSWYQPTKKSDS